MKIAILTSGILPVPAVQGGAVENLIDFYLEYNQQHRLHDITVYSVWHPDVEKHPAITSDVNHYYYINTSSFWAKIFRRVHKLLNPNEYYNYFIEYFFEQAYKHLRKEHYDCIVLENRPGYVYKLSQRGHKNLILHLHNDLLNSDSPHAKEIYQHLNKVITVSNYIKQRVETIPSQADNKTMTVYNGINLQSFTRRENPVIDRNAVGFSETDFVLAFSGRLNKDKGIDKLIEAMLLLTDLPNIKLMILGSTFFGNASNEDNFVSSLKEKALTIKERIVFTGFVPYQNMPDYLQLADIAIVPSTWDDPFPTTVLEAQAMGLPTIATNRGGIPEEVTDKSAVIVPTEQNFAEGLANAIRRLFNTPQECSDMVIAAKSNAVKYNKERFARDFFKALEPEL